MFSLVAISLILMACLRTSRPATHYSAMTSMRAPYWAVMTGISTAWQSWVRRARVDGTCARTTRGRAALLESEATRTTVIIERKRLRVAERVIRLCDKL